MSESDANPKTGAETAAVPMEADDSSTDNSVSSPNVEAAKSLATTPTTSKSTKPYSKETREVLATLSQIVEVNCFKCLLFAPTYFDKYQNQITTNQ